MLPLPLILVVAAGVVAAIALFGLLVGLGSLAVKWLRLPNEPVEKAMYEPPPPAVVPAGDPAAARVRAEVWLAAAALGRRAYATYVRTYEVRDLAEWIALHRKDEAETARRAEGEAVQAAERARLAFRAGDAAGVEAGESDFARARAALDALAVGLPDMHAADRRRLIRLTVMLVLALALAAASLWLR